MSIGPLSTLAMRETMRTQLLRTQQSFDQTTREVASGRHHDVGLVLGSSTSRAINARQMVSDIDSILDSNTLTNSRLSTAQSALSAAVEIANDFFETVVSIRQSGADRGLMVADARNMLGTMSTLLSATSNGAYVFGGANAGKPPFADYVNDPAQTARTAVTGAFTAEFGFGPDDPQAGQITAAQMQGYLGGSYAALFEDPAWGTSFSSASDGGIELRIAPHEVATSSFNANDKGIRMLVSTLVAAVDAGASQLDAETFDVFASTLAQNVSAAASEITRMQSRIGLLQERVTEASERMSLGRGMFERTIGSLENVDIGQASVRLNELATQLDTSYAVTARVQRLSILNYL